MLQERPAVNWLPKSGFSYQIWAMPYSTGNGTTQCLIGNLFHKPSTFQFYNSGLYLINGEVVFVLGIDMNSPFVCHHFDLDYSLLFSSQFLFLVFHHSFF